MASGSITSWQIDGETMETVTDYIIFHSFAELGSMTWAQKLGCTALVAPWHVESFWTRDETCVPCHKLGKFDPWSIKIQHAMGQLKLCTLISEPMS